MMFLGLYRTDCTEWKFWLPPMMELGFITKFLLPAANDLILKLPFPALVAACPAASLFALSPVGNLILTFACLNFYIMLLWLVYSVILAVILELWDCSEGLESTG